MTDEHLRNLHLRLHVTFVFILQALNAIVLDFYLAWVTAAL